MLISLALAGLDFARKQTVLSDFVDDLAPRGLVAANRVTERIFAASTDDIHNVADMADAASLSPRRCSGC